MRCVGGACEAVVVEWQPNAGVYTVLNRSRRPVIVRFSSWGAVTVLVLTPQTALELPVSAFDVPFHPDFAD